MRLKLIACTVLLRELCYLVARSPHTFDIEFEELEAHRHPNRLRELLQAKVDGSDRSDRRYDAVLLGYGLCGNAIAGLRAGAVPLIVPRAHDCCTLLLGSRAAFETHFKDNPSQPFSSTGYSERSESGFHEAYDDLEANTRYQEYVEKYGEENARYICEALSAPAKEHNRIVFIDVPQTRLDGREQSCSERAAALGKSFQKLSGSLELLRKLVDGQWDEDFLQVPPGKSVAGVYDWEEIIRVR